MADLTKEDLEYQQHGGRHFQQSNWPQSESQQSNPHAKPHKETNTDCLPKTPAKPPKIIREKKRWVENEPEGVTRSTYRAAERESLRFGEMKSRRRRIVKVIVATYSFEHDRPPNSIVIPNSSFLVNTNSILIRTDAYACLLNLSTPKCPPSNPPDPCLKASHCPDKSRPRPSTFRRYPEARNEELREEKKMDKNTSSFAECHCFEVVE
ncbi:uncharacterized protein BDR25DRAFT_348205 [Lindgomyces ingoldianus]|uniref:Uncharacterized protein n=1 Tax=Lindgomyces ingoldianus TaxID=673940 RepID=A0ACB6RHA2_9PLEO|nr:uncharacterized protein BDR25DRAFT_348205 [Lindgomyces ingoldianus]KAF2477897.1 hypothetical protein BDR25DRAFT_348205 [Lindgomyces ingoldianus]